MRTHFKASRHAGALSALESPFRRQLREYAARNLRRLRAGYDELIVNNYGWNTVNTARLPERFFFGTWSEYRSVSRTVFAWLVQSRFLNSIQQCRVIAGVCLVRKVHDEELLFECKLSTALSRPSQQSVRVECIVNAACVGGVHREPTSAARRLIFSRLMRACSGGMRYFS